MDEAAQWAKWLGVSADAGAPAICASFGRVAKALAPTELTRWPIYCLPLSTLPSSFTSASRHCGGWYADLGYFWAREYLPHDDGPGPTLIVKDYRTADEENYIAAGAQQVYRVMGDEVSLDELIGDIRELTPLDSITNMCRVLVHELAHAVESLADGEFQCWAEGIKGKRARDAANRRFAELVTAKQRQPGPDAQPAQHGLRFTRIVAHLDRRLRSAGVRSGEFFAAGHRYGQREYPDCYAALTGELAKTKTTSIAELLAMPMPLAFAQCELACNAAA